MNIAIFSGELSGDLIGGALADALRVRLPEVELWGMGSGAMRQAGVEVVEDSAAWGAISLAEAVKKIPGLLLRVVPKMKALLQERRPDVVVLIDFGAFNVRVAEYCKERGLKVCYYFPPGSWRRTGSKGTNLAALTDVVATPFPWSAERFRSLGVNAVYVGHPLMERVHPLLTREAFAAEFGMYPDRPIIGILPGSRQHEVTSLMPTLLETTRILYREIPDAQFVIGVAPTISQEMMAGYLQGENDLLYRMSDIWHDFVQEAEKKILEPVTRTAGKLGAPGNATLVTAEGVQLPAETLKRNEQARRRSDRLHERAERILPPTILARGLTYDVMAHSDVLLVCSGTATLEATIFTTPMVILYKGSRLMEWEYRLRRFRNKIQDVGLPNILAQKRIVPELIQDAATPEAIAEQALRLLNDLTVRQRVRADLKAVREMLGEPGASARTADLIVDLLKK